MAPSTPLPAVLATGFTAAGLLSGWHSSTFVSTGTPAARNLRASSYAQAKQQSNEAGTSNNFLGGAGAVATMLTACGLASARRRTVCRAEAEASAAVEKKKDWGEANIKHPMDNDPFDPRYPAHFPNTGGYFSKNNMERHAITWTSKQEHWFDLPTGLPALMNVGENLCYFRKKEQCLMVGKQLRKLKIDDLKIYRISKEGNVTFMHPADGVFPDKVNKGRVQVNGRPFSSGREIVPGQCMNTRFASRPYEVDPLTVMFMRARMCAYEDVENLFPLPKVQGWAEFETDEEGQKTVVPGTMQLGSRASL